MERENDPTLGANRWLFGFNENTHIVSWHGVGFEEKLQGLSG